jgi:hypothetical protein
MNTFRIFIRLRPEDLLTCNRDKTHDLTIGHFHPGLGDVTKSDPRTLLRLSTFKNLTHPSSKDEVKLIDCISYATEFESDHGRVSNKGKNADHDASHCSRAWVDSSEEGDDSDSDIECDNVTTWNCSQYDALTSFLPYIRGYDEDISSPCSDSPDNGSTTSGTTSDTPASSESNLTRGNGHQGNSDASPSAGRGASNNSNNSILGIRGGIRVKTIPDPQPLPHKKTVILQVTSLQIIESVKQQVREKFYLRGSASQFTYQSRVLRTAKLQRAKRCNANLCLFFWMGKTPLGVWYRPTCITVEFGAGSSLTIPTEGLRTIQDVKSRVGESMELPYELI